MPETSLALESAIAGLPEGARVPLVLYAVEGYRYEEIATLLGLALGTIKAQIHRARRLLMEVLKP
jgi:RNA polymerase sigma-70 factor (ECF subfamily)